MAGIPMRRVAVLGGSRIPFCRSYTAYAELSNLDMLTTALGGLVDRFGLHGVHIDEVVGGAVVTHAKDWNLAREAVIGIALGSDTTSDAPIVFQRKFAQRLVQLSRAKSLGQRAAVFKGFTPAELAPQPPSISEPRTGLSMDEHCELMAKEWGIGRVEQDELALASHVKAAAAWREGFYAGEVVAFAGLAS